MMASGLPMRLVSAGNDVECQRMTYNPNTLDVSAYGSQSEPATVNLDGQGIVSGVVIHSKRNDNDHLMNVIGPGRLARAPLDPKGKTGADDQPLARLP